MKIQINGTLRRKLLRILDAKSASEADSDELFSVLLQVSFAVMLIFMIAFFLFMANVGGEISRLDQMKQQIEVARRDRLLRALEKTADRFRSQYGLNLFLRIDPESGGKEYGLSGLIVDGRIVTNSPVQRAFINGGKTAYADYSAPISLEQRWREIVFSVAGMNENELNREERNWLNRELNRACQELRNEVAEVQNLAAAAFQSHLVRNPALVDDAEIRTLIETLNRTENSALRRELALRLNETLKRYVRNRLRTDGQLPLIGE